MPEPIWLSRILLDQMHAELIREYGGSPGIRDANLIESALARPRNKWLYGEEYIAELAAAYGFGLAKNHGYVDGNKRIAFMAMFVFLYQNGFFLDAPNSEVVSVMLEVTAGNLSEDALSEWIRSRMRSRHPWF
ncbi:type II toxin-antitoxin system death-on-curing family toxin [Candidatus Poribacteria bacterium]|nr:type II toxin-antitoxin system death-on-curing family toxin [Candidatus Poribacteria bacterium]